MARYFFENGHRLVDPTGLECRDHQEALFHAAAIALAIAIEGPPISNRKIAVVDAEGREIGSVPIDELDATQTEARGQESANEKVGSGDGGTEARGGEA